MIDASQVHIRFRTKTGHVDAVRDASFHVGEGEVFGLVGESGSGKSTILRALTGLVPLASPSTRHCASRSSSTASGARTSAS